MTRSHLGRWGYGAGLAGAIATAISPAVHAATATGFLQMRLEIQKSCTIAVRAGPNTDGGRNAVSVDCETNTPYFIEIARAAPNGTGGTGGGEPRSIVARASPPGADPPDTPDTAVTVTVHY